MTPDQMTRLLSRLEGDLLRAWEDFIVYVMRQNPVDELVTRMHHPSGVVHGISDAAERFAAMVVGSAWDAAIATARFLSDELGSLITFDIHDPSVVAWARLSQAETARALASEQERLFAQILTRENTPANILSKAAAPYSPDLKQVARDIRAAIGLTPEQEQYVANYRRELKEGRYADARRRELHNGQFDRTIDAAVRAGKPLTKVQIDAMVKAYRQAWINLRATTITRTEALRTMHEGQFQMYQQAIASGKLDAERVTRKWVAARDKRVRDTHRKMNGQEVKGMDPFHSPRGATLRFPGDPTAPARETINCRCAVSVRLTPAPRRR